MKRNRYANVDYQSRILNRLANIAYLHGGMRAMKASLDKAMVHIWREVVTT